MTNHHGRNVCPFRYIDFINSFILFYFIYSFLDLARLKSITRKKNDYVTNALEPNVPFWRMKLPATLLSVSVVLLLISCAFATVLGVVLYRMSIVASLSIYHDDLSTSFTIIFSTTTAAIINLILIVRHLFCVDRLTLRGIIF